MTSEKGAQQMRASYFSHCFLHFLHSLHLTSVELGINGSSEKFPLFCPMMNDTKGNSGAAILRRRPRHKSVRHPGSKNTGLTPPGYRVENQCVQNFSVGAKVEGFFGSTENCPMAGSLQSLSSDTVFREVTMGQQSLIRQSSPSQSDSSQSGFLRLS